MEKIQKENLVTGYTYIIECTSKQSGQSGTKIGIFEELTYPCGENPPFAKFKQLQDLPNATMPSGMGTLSNNYYSTLNHRFWLLKKTICLCHCLESYYSLNATVEASNSSQRLANIESDSDDDTDGDDSIPPLILIDSDSDNDFM
jgi:hypothetical protein